MTILKGFKVVFRERILVVICAAHCGDDILNAGNNNEEKVFESVLYFDDKFNGLWK